MSLDIVTPKGKEAAACQTAAIKAVLAAGAVGLQAVETDHESAAAIDCLFVRNGILESIAEVKTRYNCTHDHFRGVFRNDWLVSADKIRDMRDLSVMLKVPAYGILYLFDSHVVLMLKLYNSDGKRAAQWQTGVTRTQRSVNGGSAIRLNCFIQMETASIIHVPQ